jgi:hypothetical protein
MNQVELVQTITSISLRAQKTLIFKNSAYNPGTDKLSHFKEGNLTSQEIVSELLSHTTKHWKKVGLLKTEPIDSRPLEEWQESLDDIKNYMSLLECLLIDLLRERE